MGVNETRVRSGGFSAISRRAFRNFHIIHNYLNHPNGRLWVIWKKSSLRIQALDTVSQWIHLKVWLVLGDFNCVRYGTERQSSVPPDTRAIGEFSNALYAARLDDLNTHGCFFTWTNKQDDGDRKWMKLDRALVNSGWQATFPGSYADALVAGVSDHSPIVVSLFSAVVTRPRQFRFLNSWIADATFLPLVEDTWLYSVRGCPMFQFVSRLKLGKGKLKTLHRSSYSNISDRVALVRDKLRVCQERVRLDPMNILLLGEERDLCLAFSKLRDAELSIVYQRAKELDIKMADACTAYFFAKVAARRSTCTITKKFLTHLVLNALRQLQFLMLLLLIILSCSALRVLRSLWLRMWFFLGDACLLVRVISLRRVYRMQRSNLLCSP
ncbi:hypothetical protein RND81_13G034400 [Saponaria officinalis]|uniref:Uncharacterized protein n=1 Tax=Saponaria officinalis TaxID=3572 RepID=A0AAW1GY62_SAPOF